MSFRAATCSSGDRAPPGRSNDFVQRLEEESPGTRHAIVSGYDQMRPLLQGKYPPAGLNACARCGEPTINEICKACELRERIARISSVAQRARKLDREPREG